MSKILYRSKRNPFSNAADYSPVILLLIDPQIDFHEGGKLAVEGALADSERIANMIVENKDLIDEIYITLDSHHKGHIAHPTFWKDANGNRPTPFMPIKSSEVGVVWFPSDISLLQNSIVYLSELEKLIPPRNLIIWPEHCLIGSEGHSVVESINNALDIWSSCRYDRDVHFVHKGMNCLTEMYSAVRAEVPNSDPLTEENKGFLEEVRKAKRLIIGGQALSHCVNYTTRDIMRDWKSNRNPAGHPFQVPDLSNIYLLKDGCSSVGGFGKDSEQFLEDIEKDGVKISDTRSCLEGIKESSYPTGVIAPPKIFSGSMLEPVANAEGTEKETASMSK